jgi:hypothetical protein
MRWRGKMNLELGFVRSDLLGRIQSHHPALRSDQRRNHLHAVWRNDLCRQRARKPEHRHWLAEMDLETIDPSTGQPPSDPTVGFLPPDTDGIEGQGAVTFSVAPTSGLSTGTALANTTTVVFDADAPLSTQTWTNTIDITPPQSAVAALPSTAAQTSFTVSWSGTTVASAIS